MRIYVFDMDGVLFRMDDPLPGAADAIRRLEERGERAFFLTNNSSKSREDYVEKLARFDIHTSVDEIMTSAYATGLLFQEMGVTGKRVYVVGENGLKRELRLAGMEIVNEEETVDDTADLLGVDYVVAGWDRGFTYTKLAQAHQAIVNGASFIATNRDVTYPDSGGRTLPGGGAIVAAIETCTGLVPRTVGKPEPYSLELILKQAGVSPQDCLVIGDRLDTDIAIGKRVGAPTALVLTGVSTREEAETAGPDLHPDQIWNDLTEFP